MGGPGFSWNLPTLPMPEKAGFLSLPIFFVLYTDKTLKYMQQGDRCVSTYCKAPADQP